MPRKTRLKSGGTRLVEAGKKPVLLGLTPEQHEKISAAAEHEHRRITQFLTHYGLRAAEKILKNLPE
jgi:uncharacterized protein (DUF1778 family)